MRAENFSNWNSFHISTNARKEHSIETTEQQNRITSFNETMRFLLLATCLPRHGWAIANIYMLTMADRFVAGSQIGWQAATDWLYFGLTEADDRANLRRSLSDSSRLSWLLQSERWNLLYSQVWPAALHSDSPRRARYKNDCTFPPFLPPLFSSSKNVE